MSEKGRIASRLQEMLVSYRLEALGESQAERLETYFHLLVRWNAKTNLTALRDEETILRRHFLESIQCARLLPAGLESLLDFGSGAGFPGIPCAVCRPEVAVTLAESQGKKAAFLREATRVLGLGTIVHGDRVERLAEARRFGAVTLRAVDQMESASLEALGRLESGGWLMLLTTEARGETIAGALSGVSWRLPARMVGSNRGMIWLGRKD